MTPFQTRSVTAAVQMDRRRWAIVTAWHTEAFQRTKKLPKLEKVLNARGDEKPAAAPKQSPEQMFGSLAKMLGVKREKAKREAGANG